MVLGRWGLVRVDKITNLYGFALSVTFSVCKPLKTTIFLVTYNLCFLRHKGRDTFENQMIIVLRIGWHFVTKWLTKRQPIIDTIFLFGQILNYLNWLIFIYLVGNISTKIRIFAYQNRFSIYSVKQWKKSRWRMRLIFSSWSVPR